MRLRDRKRERDLPSLAGYLETPFSKQVSNCDRERESTVKGSVGNNYQPSFVIYAMKREKMERGGS